MILSTEHRQVADMARRFANEVIRPEAEKLDREESFPAHIYKAMGETGWGILYLLFCWTLIPHLVSFVECFLLPGRVRAGSVVASPGRTWG